MGRGDDAVPEKNNCYLQNRNKRDFDEDNGSQMSFSVLDVEV